jgi:hypothetical protein
MRDEEDAMPLPAVAARRGGKSKNDRLAEGEAMLRDRALGVQVSDLCAKYDVSPATLYRRLDDAVKARIAPTVDAYREEQNRLLDDLMSRWQQQSDAADAMVQAGLIEESMGLVERGMARRSEALNGMLRVSERRSKMNGLDAPVKVDAHVTVSGALDQRIDEMLAEMERAS